MHSFSKAPASDKAALTKLAADRKDTTNVVVSDAAAREQNGLNGIAFRRSAKIRGKDVEFNSVALNGIGARAVLAIAFNLTTLDEASRRELEAVLTSVAAVQ